MIASGTFPGFLHGFLSGFLRKLLQGFIRWVLPWFFQSYLLGFLPWFFQGLLRSFLCYSQGISPWCTSLLPPGTPFGIFSDTFSDRYLFWHHLRGFFRNPFNEMLNSLWKSYALFQKVDQSNVHTPSFSCKSHKPHIWKPDLTFVKITLLYRVLLNLKRPRHLLYIVEDEPTTEEIVYVLTNSCAQLYQNKLLISCLAWEKEAFPLRERIGGYLRSIYHLPTPQCKSVWQSSGCCRTCPSPDRKLCTILYR